MKVLRDKTKLYTFEEALQIYEGIKPPRLTSTEMILLLLYSTNKPLYGRTLFMKELFLLKEEVLKNHYGNESLEDLHYVPFRFGMYSFKIGKLVEELEFAEYVERRGKKNTRDESFALTEKGREHARELLDRIPEDVLDKVRLCRTGWDELGTDGILRYVYQHYPQYTDRSELKKKYKRITWGRGRG